ncbi:MULTISPECIES: zinc ribbon domain-containing protein [unclassified Actinomyces]|uniref:zinc ribbon domain-containing protein n=1 Tax=unclassified Actinomyces TaxID=2609248 RepID=UPI002016FD36|nr:MULTISPECIES: zinc ribbon domain-containing protein [unclassified Actinomyces]MCL3777880.1 zinc ribbon domain-containing protein [Actinomyces sp. AC-20-1]MCL3789239.1 zinc ribbon domain-containing protein [Actinomyces sp. 187325]MCL3791592.1 zinc ribbon domain-containing protein [Actinomyces sp. 186855]MCL3793534.1 zinc ribbon domain-containing protein [Actinomyces sp. 217892]
MSTGYTHSPYTGNGGRPRQYDIQPWRKWAYYGGGVLQVVGLLAFLAVFLTMFLGLGSLGSHPGQISSQVQRGFTLFPVAFIGILVSVAGKSLQSLGRKGLAGAGVILSPQGEARDAEPWNRSQGAQDQQRLEEVPGLAGLGTDLGARAGAAPQIRVRCRSCGFLETEDATFCSGCGARM